MPIDVRLADALDGELTGVLPLLMYLAAGSSPVFQHSAPVCGELLNLAENTSVPQSCESFTYG